MRHATEVRGAAAARPGGELRRLAAVLAGLLLMFSQDVVLGPSAGPPRPSPSAGPAAQTGAGEPRYHVRLLRARWEGGVPGSALFRPDRIETIVPLPEQESWGLPGQIESLRRILAASALEPVPGLVIRTGLAPDGEPYRFRTGLGTTLIDIFFTGESLDDGWHRISIRAEEERGEEVLDAGLLIPDAGTVVLVAPLPVEGDDEALIVGITPLAMTAGEMDGVLVSGLMGVTVPRLIYKEDPVYPVEDRLRGLTGKVMMQAVIRADGTPAQIVVLGMSEGGERLAGSAVEALQRWRYEPGTLDGQPVDVLFNIVMRFTLE